MAKKAKHSDAVMTGILVTKFKMGEVLGGEKGAVGSEGLAGSSPPAGCSPDIRSSGSSL